MVEYFWSKEFGKFVDKTNGVPFRGATFHGSISEWNETLIEVMIDVTNNAVRENGSVPIEGVSWKVDPDIFSVICQSVLFNGAARQIGVIGAPREGLVLNIPLIELPSLMGSGMIQLYQGNDRLLGSVKVFD